jgi:hypothetical protein
MSFPMGGWELLVSEKHGVAYKRTADSSAALHSRDLTLRHGKRCSAEKETVKQRFVAAQFQQIMNELYPCAGYCFHKRT